MWFLPLKLVEQIYMRAIYRSFHLVTQVFKFVTWF